MGFVVTIVVTLLTRAPSREMQDFIDQVRIPSGGEIMDQSGAPATGR